MGIFKHLFNSCWFLKIWRKMKVFPQCWYFSHHVNTFPTMLILFPPCCTMLILFPPCWYFSLHVDTFPTMLILFPPCWYFSLQTIIYFCSKFRNRRKQRRFYKEKTKKIKKSRDIINHKGDKNQHELKRCLKMPILRKTYTFFTTHQVYFIFLNITNKSIIFISDSC